MWFRRLLSVDRYYCDRFWCVLRAGSATTTAEYR